MDKLIDINYKIASILLDCEEFENTLHQVFAIVGSAINVDRIYYFEVYRNEEDKAYYTSQRLEWVNNNVEPMINNPELQDIPVEAFEIFMTPLRENKAFEAIISQLDDCETKSLLQSQDIKSILVLPIIIKGELRGFVGFDDCTTEKHWNEDEFRFLKSITTNLTSTILRFSLQQKNNFELNEKISILETIGDGFFSMNNRFEVTYWNEMAERLFAVSKEEAIGKIIFEINVCKVFINRIKKILANNTPLHSFGYERHFKAQNLWFDVQFSYHGNSSSVIIKNITARKKANIRLRNSYRNLSSKNETLKEIAFLQSHETRAPLARIIGLTECLLVEKHDVDEEKYLLKALQNSAVELDNTVRKITKNTYN